MHKTVVCRYASRHKLQSTENKIRLESYNFFFLGNFVRKILQPALHLITKEDEDKIPEAMGHEASCFSDVPLKQEISEARERHSPDLSFLVVKNNMGEKCLFVDLGK